MQTHFILLSSIIIVRLSSAHINPFDQESSLWGNKYRSLPQNYTQQGTFNLKFNPRSITYSLDQNWIVYCSKDDSFPNQIFFRNRTSYTDESSVTIKGSQQRNESITTFAFSPSGNLLFVGTETYNLFVCKFSANMKDEDCQKSYFLGQGKAIFKMKINSANKIAAVGYGDLFVLNFTSEGDLTLQFHIQFDKVLQLYPIWHPKAETDTLVIGGRNNTFSDGFLIVLNITTQAMNTLTLNTTGVLHMNILKDGQTLLVSEKAELAQYNLSMTEVTRVGTITTIVQQIQRVSQDGKIVVGLQMQSPGRLVVYSVEQQQAQSSQFNTFDDVSANATVDLKQIFSIDCDAALSYAISSDVNEILVQVDNQTEVNRYILCLNNTYFSNLQCLTCSSPCKTCHVNANLCFDCINNTYAVKNGFCLKCNTVLDGCLSCSNSTFCLNCDTIAGFIKNPSNGVCQCSDFNYVKEGFCVTCDGKSICKRCNSTTFCLVCNKLNNWQQTPVNGTCVCQDYFFNSSSKCELCDSLRICRSCYNSSFCTKCDTSKGFFQDPVNGNCVCPASFTLNSGKCISCLVQGCASCLSENVCYECESSSSLSDGKCVKGSSSIIFIFPGIGLVVILGGIFVYCKCKNMKKKKLEESLITSGKQEETTKGATIKSDKENQNKTDPLIKKNLIKQKVEIEPKINEEVSVSKLSKLNQEKRDILIDQKDEEQDDDYEPSFIKKYKKLMQKSEIEDKSNLKQRLRQEQNKIEQKAPSKLSKVEKKIEEKPQYQFDRQVKKIQPKVKDNSKLLKKKQRFPQVVQSQTKFEEYDESQQTEKPKIKQEKGNLKKKPQANLKYQQIPQSPMEDELNEEKPKPKPVKPKPKEQQKLKQQKSKLKQQKSVLNKVHYNQPQETIEQKPQFSEMKGQSSLKKGSNPHQSKLSKQQKSKETAGFNDTEQAAYNQLTDEEKMMLNMVRGSFGQS